MKPFSLLIKPASADCNMNCHYCFYLEKSSLYPDQKVHRMNGGTLETMISSYMKTLMFGIDVQSIGLTMTMNLERSEKLKRQ